MNERITQINKSDAIVSRILLYVFIALFLFAGTTIIARALFDLLVPRYVQAAVRVLTLVALLAQVLHSRWIRRRAEGSAT